MVTYITSLHSASLEIYSRFGEAAPGGTLKASTHIRSYWKAMVQPPGRKRVGGGFHHPVYLLRFKHVFIIELKSKDEDGHSKSSKSVYYWQDKCSHLEVYVQTLSNTFI